jgi:hypothetical protein
MSFSLPKVRVGAPQRFATMSVFPLFSENGAGVDYLLADEAIATNEICVEEVSEQGSVPNLSVENKSSFRVLFLEGEELIGAKQNRILNTSVLVAAHSKIRIPVSCVEQGRWGYRGKTFSSSGRHMPRHLRKALKVSVADSLKRKTGYHSDQQEVWKQVADYDAAFCVGSHTAAMADTFAALDEKMNDARKSFAYAEGASGVAVALGPDVVCVELFDKPATCRKVWDRVLSGFIVDALRGSDDAPLADESAVEKVLAHSTAANWSAVGAVAEGQEYRAEFGKEHASALCLDHHLIHGSVIGA